MISKEKYQKLRDWSTKGANLSSYDLEEMQEFEEAHGLIERHGNIGFIKPLQS